MGESMIVCRLQLVLDILGYEDMKSYNDEGTVAIYSEIHEEPSSSTPYGGKPTSTV